MAQGWTAGPAPTDAWTPTATSSGLLTPGNIDLYQRPPVKNPDGTSSTVRSLSFEQDGHEILIPTVIGGKVVSDDQAIAYYKKTGQHLGIFDTPAHATAYASQLHDDYAAGKYTPKGTRAEIRMPAGVPARGRGTQLDLDQSQRAVDFATTPLAHPTGIGGIDGLTSPVGLVSLAAGGAGIARAGLTGGALAGVKAAVANVAPIVKYEIARGALEHAGVPSVIAMPTAMAISGYTKGAKAVPVAAEAEAVSAPGYPRLTTTEPPAVAPTAAAPAAVDEFTVARSARSNALPDQKALNEAAIAARQAAYQARQAAAANPDAIVPASGKQHFTAPEWAAFRELRARGVRLEEAATGARAAGQLARQLGGATDAEVAAAVKHRGVTGKW